MIRLRTALNGATTLLGTLEQDIDAAVASGYDGLEFWLQKLNTYLETGTLAALRQRLDRTGLKRLTLNSLERFSFNDPSGHQRMLVDAERLCRLANALGIETVIVVPSPKPAWATREDVMKESERSLRDLLAIAERYEVKLGVEFIGSADNSINNLGDALALIRRMNHPRLGVVVDTFHFYANGSRMEDLADLKPGELTIFHINDVEPGDKASLSDDKRLYPGLGVLPLKEMLATLKSVGYDGFVSVEIFRPEYWHQPVASVARTALEHTRRFL